MILRFLKIQQSYSGTCTGTLGDAPDTDFDITGIRLISNMNTRYSAILFSYSITNYFGRIIHLIFNFLTKSFLKGRIIRPISDQPPVIPVSVGSLTLIITIALTFDM